MNAPAGRKRPSFIQRLLNVRSIRTKLGVGFGVLLVLGAFNIGVYYWGAHQRAQAFRELQQAIERQMIITEVVDLLEDQKTYVALMTGVLGMPQEAPPTEEEHRGFARDVDTIATRIADMLVLADPAERPALEALHAKAEALAESWIRFYDLQWSDPSKGYEELYVRAEPLAEELLTVDLPAAVQHEREQLARVRAGFIQVDRTFERLAWTSFVFSALLGGLLAFFISRDLLRAISALEVGADRIGAGDLDHRIQIPNRDELGEVAQSFNEMAARLDQRSAELAASRDQIKEQRDDLEQALSHLKATQAQLIQAEKMASLGALTAGIAHEIKNPLNFVNNFAQLSAELADELRESLRTHFVHTDSAALEEVETILEDLKTNAEKINEHGRRADGIVRSMLLHSRGKPGEHRKVEFNAFVEEYVSLSYHGMRAQVADFNVEIERDYDDSVGEVELVPQEIGRVLINLLNNAFYAVHERARGGEGPYAPKVTVHTRSLDGAVQVCVADNGPGMPEAVRARIFEPFFTTKPTGEGTGLGLSMSYDIVVRGHGGSLSVESEAGEGTTFAVTLPGHPNLTSPV